MQRPYLLSGVAPPPFLVAGRIFTRGVDAVGSSPWMTRIWTVGREAGSERVPFSISFFVSCHGVDRKGEVLFSKTAEDLMGLSRLEVFVTLSSDECDGLKNEFHFGEFLTQTFVEPVGN
jgi:hypothetical protein